jgi:hypothetical protein
LETSLSEEAYGMNLDLLNNAAVIEDAERFMQEKKKELEQQSPLQRQPMEQPPQEPEQKQQEEQEPETFNKTF